MLNLKNSSTILFLLQDLFYQSRAVTQGKKWRTEKRLCFAICLHWNWVCTGFKNKGLKPRSEELIREGWDKDEWCPEKPTESEIRQSRLESRLDLHQMLASHLLRVWIQASCFMKSLFLSFINGADCSGRGSVGMAHIHGRVFPRSPQLWLNNTLSTWSRADPRVSAFRWPALVCSGLRELV